MPVLAVDIGGTKLAAALVDSTGRVLGTQRVPTPTGVDAEGLWSTLVSLLDRVRGPGEVEGVGVGCGGPMRWPSGIVSPLNIPAWREFPLRSRLQDAFPGLPVRVHNDAVALAVGEHWRGAGRGWDNVLGMVVSTGVGGGLVLGGRLVDGASGNAGHVGHVVVDPDGPPCVCGGVGCLEAIARGPAVAAWARANGWRDGAPGSAKDVAEDAQRGHPVALAALERAGRAIGVGLASAMHLLDLDVVCVGGGLAQAGPLLFTPMEAEIRRHVGMPWAKEIRVVAASQGQDAGLVGAAALVLAGDRYWSPED